jgi:hypothetical protein
MSAHFSSNLLTWRRPTKAETCRRETNKVCITQKSVVFWGSLLPSIKYFCFKGSLKSCHWAFKVHRVIKERGRSQWPRGLSRGSAPARLLRLWVWIPRRAWMSVGCECCVSSGRGLCDELHMQPHLRRVHDDVVSPIIFIIMTLAKINNMPPLRMVVKPKHVGAI